MDTGYIGEPEEVDISGFSEYVDLISNRMDVYSQTVVNPGQVQLIVDEHNGRTEAAVRDYFDIMTEQGLLNLDFDGMNKMPDAYSLTDKGRYVLRPDNDKKLGEDYWVGQIEDLVVILGEEYSFQQEFASDSVAEANFHRLNEENVETLLEP